MIRLLIVSMFVLLLGGNSVRAVPPRVDLWQESAVEDRIDIEQLSAVDGSHVQVQAGMPAGQTFVARSSEIARIDLKIGNMGDGRPGKISLYRWRGNYASTVAVQPLWSEGLDLAGADTLRLHSFRPGIAAQAGSTYFLELKAEARGPYRLRHTMGDADHYRAGALRDSARWRPKWDLWFRVFSPAPKGSEAQAATPRMPLDTWISQLPVAAPPTRSSRVTRRSYYNRVARRANFVRSSALNSCGRKGDELALPEAFLYRASCEEGKCKEIHARYVRDLYRQAYFWRACGEKVSLGEAPDPRPSGCASVCEGGRVDWNPLRRATTAYLWTQESEEYTQADHALVRAQLADLGRRIWATRELGTHNRALQTGVTYRVLAELIPDAPEAAAWRNYADRIWSELLEAGDSREDSTEYASVAWWPAVLEYAAVSGREAEIFADPTFRGWVERAYQLMTPLGPAADLGNSVGFGRDSAGFVWLFEAAARHYREPRFREAALRAFRFHTDSVRDRQPQYDGLSQTLAAIGWAYFAADASIKPSPPPARTEAAMNVPIVDASHAWAAAPDRAVGQRFSLSASPLVGLDLRSLGGDAQRVGLTVWEWQGTLAATRAAAPLFLDGARVEPDGAIRVSPFIDAPIGTEIYVEARPVGGTLQLAGSKPGALPTKTGGLVDPSGASRGADLWYRAVTLQGLGSVVTSRRPVSERPRSLYGPRPFYSYEFGEGQVPDKLVLRSGFEEDAFHVVFNLVHRFGHGESEQGALVSVVDGGSLLLQDGPIPYWSHQAQRENESRPHLQRYSGGTLSSERSPTRIEHFRDARAATVARLSYEEPRGWGAQVERRVFFVKDRFLFTRDCFTTPEAMRASMGTLWHPTDIAEPTGPNWYDVFVRSPLANVYRIRNKPRRMLVYFVPREETEIEAFVEETYLAGPECAASADLGIVSAECRVGPPYILSQRRSGSFEPGERRCFDTLLIPHDLEEPATEVARSVRVLRADDATVALELRLGDEEWLVVDDTSGKALALPGLEAQLRYAIVRAEPDATPYVFVSDARRLRWRDVDAEWSVPVSLEMGARPGRRAPN